MNMSRVLYSTLLFAMTAIGFGEFRGSLCDQISMAKNKTIEANRVSNSARRTTEVAARLCSDRIPPRNAVLGVRG
jgi:hypothetical protein